jgi:predicted RNase H-like nuclease (RuvC/YqgF family)
MWTKRYVRSRIVFGRSLVSNREDNSQIGASGAFGAKGAGGAKAAGGFSRLESAVEATLARVTGLQGDLDQARAKVREMDELLRKFSQGEDDPARQNSRLQELERENKDLLEKLQLGKEGVERLLARIRFLEEQG